jgi:hypothetical protein
MMTKYQKGGLRAMKLPAGNEIAGGSVFFCFDRVRPLEYIDLCGV